MIPRDRAFNVGARFLKDTNPNANINAFLAHWRQELGIGQLEARELFDEVLAAMQELGIDVPDYAAFRAIAPAILDIVPGREPDGDR